MRPCRHIVIIECEWKGKFVFSLLILCVCDEVITLNFPKLFRGLLAIIAKLLVSGFLEDCYF